MIRVGLAHCRPGYDGLAAPWGPGKHYPELERLFGEHGMELFDVEELPTHGGSIRVYAQATGGPQARSPRRSSG